MIYRRHVGCRCENSQEYLTLFSMLFQTCSSLFLLAILKYVLSRVTNRDISTQRLLFFEQAS